MLTAQPEGNAFFPAGDLGLSRDSGGQELSGRLGMVEEGNKQEKNRLQQHCSFLNFIFQDLPIISC